MIAAPKKISDFPRPASYEILLAPTFFLLASFYFIYGSFPMTGAWGDGLRILFSFFIIFVFGGYLAKSLLFPISSTGILETLAYSFALNLLVIVPVCILTFEFAKDIAWALHLMTLIHLGLWVAVLIAGFYRIQCRSALLSVARRPGLGEFFFFLLLLGFGFLYYSISGFSMGDVPSGEEVLHLGIMRKLLENPAIAFDNIYYRPLAHYPYLYAPYHLAMAMTAKISGVDILAVFGKFRAFSSILSFSIFFSLLRALFRRASIYWMGISAVLILVFYQLIGDLHPHYWGQLVPYAYPTDAAAVLFMPAICLFLIRALDLNLPESKRYLSVLPFLIFGLALIHLREAYYLLLYCIFIGLGTAWLAGSQDKKEVIRRCVKIVGFTVLVCLFFLLRSRFLPSGFSDSEWIKKAGELRELRCILKDFDLSPFSSARLGEYEGQLATLFLPWFLFGILVTPVLVLFRRKPVARILFSILFFYLVVLRWPLLRTLVNALTYSEMFMISVRMISLWCYVILVLVLYALSAATAKRLSWILLFAPLVYFLWPLLNCLNHQNLFNKDWYLGWVFFGSMILWFLSRKGRDSKLEDFFSSPERPGQRKYLIFALYMLLLVSHGPQENLWVRFLEKNAGPDVVATPEWYRKSSLERKFPLDLITFIRGNIPIHSTFAYDFKYTYYLPMMADQFTISAGYIIQEEARFVWDYLKLKGDTSLEIRKSDSWQDKIKKFIATFDRHMAITGKEKPIFNPAEPVEETLRYVRGMGIGYIVLHPENYRTVSQRLEQRPGVFKKIYDRQQYAVYEVRP